MGTITCKEVFGMSFNIFEEAGKINHDRFLSSKHSNKTCEMDCEALKVGIKWTKTKG